MLRINLIQALVIWAVMVMIAWIALPSGWASNNFMWISGFAIGGYWAYGMVTRPAGVRLPMRIPTDRPRLSRRMSGRIHNAGEAVNSAKLGLSKQKNKLKAFKIGKDDDAAAGDMGPH